MGYKIVLLVALFMISLSSIYFEESVAAEQSVRVTLPNFEVKLNGNRVENEYREYPLLLYKDTTYFPITWYDSRLLGLEAEWNPKDGLNIAKGKVASSFMPYQTNQKNSNSYKAKVSTAEIKVNGKLVDNSHEEYPLLSFNQVTYFPLTWKFAHDEFGWEYEWDPSKGLAITSDNPQLKTVNLTSDAGENGVAVFKNYYYFTETIEHTNQVYRVPENNTSNKELVYAYDLDTSHGINKSLKFEIRDDELWFSYHVGGATMGSDVYCKVNDDGKAENKYRGYLDFKDSSYGSLIINQSVPPGGNNLSWIPKGEEPAHGKKVGDPNLIYGWHIVDNRPGRGFGGDRSTTIIGDDAYLLGSPYPVETGDLNNVYKINLKTNETEKITHSELANFKIIDNKLYYVKDADHLLYSSDLDGTNEHKLSDNKAASWYSEIDGHVYYTVADIKGQFNLYKAEPSKEDTLVLIDPLESVQLVNDKLICKLAAGGDYGVKVLDKSGKLNLAIADQVSNVYAYNDAILIISAEDKSIKVVK
ncbi:DUF5050 domain-containing protein [Paenibacillus sp. SYP-B3998]|uniref:DUF5050 domain-containing protein n=1 Tax=Paenibacillus sp. SYP-B3998 TaxID=2678564 RepID=A0A6G4A3E4_9BACL|nr:DUF5050 domain-containing protein [Paenibacillus sp. SYP-B3998]NEW08341.1 DUF5050 domain-containing protein [Paenibacillus sp. SYP-B3998]